MRSLLRLISLIRKRLNRPKLEPVLQGQPVTITGCCPQLNGQWQALAIEQDQKGMIRLRLEKGREE